ncbi:MAG: hypothetical protein JXQ75_10680 [Phycisphaerae bacterium]|nr:hypothetical protein [Phycisphaerae bacterium]
MDSSFCFFINLSLDVMQAVINVLFSFYSLFGITVPDLRASFGSIFGCNV